MGKTIIRILAILSIIALCSCKNTKTPKDFMCHPIINQAINQADNLYLRCLITKLISQNIRPFNQKSLFDKNSIIIIDTIFYSTLVDKMVVFVIIQNVLSKYDEKNTDTIKKWNEGFFFYGYRQNKNISNYSVESNNEQLDLKFATGSDRF